MLSQGNVPKNEEPTSDFTFTRMLQHTGWFWSRISYQRTIWQHWSIPHTPLTSLQLILPVPLTEMRGAHCGLSRRLWNKGLWTWAHRESVPQDWYWLRLTHSPASTQIPFSEASRGEYPFGGHEEQRSDWGVRQSLVIVCGARPEERRQSSLLRRLPKTEWCHKKGLFSPPKDWQHAGWS